MTPTSIFAEETIQIYISIIDITGKELQCKTGQTIRGIIYLNN